MWIIPLTRCPGGSRSSAWSAIPATSSGGRFRAEWQHLVDVQLSSLTGQRKCPTMETLTLLRRSRQDFRCSARPHDPGQAATLMGVRTTRRILAAYIIM